MKRIFLTIFSMWMTIATFAQISQVVDVPNEDIEIASIDNYTQVSYGDFYNYVNIGHPQIPIVYKQYAIPIDASDVSLNISSCGIDTLLSDVYLYPVQYPQPSNSSNMSDFTEPNDEIYQQVTLYPNIVAEIVSDTRMMGFRIVKVACYPFAYIPRERVLYKRRVDYTLDYSSASEILFDAPKISDRRAKSAQKYIASIVENRSEVLNTNISPVVNQRMSATDLSVQNDVIPDYVIITNNELKAEFQRLADWKTQKGVPTIIKTIEEIEIEYIGADLVDKIKNYLTDFKNRWGDEGLYLLLGGDSDIIPYREIKSWVPKEKDKLYATDACYVDPSFTINWSDFTKTSSSTRSIFMGRLPMTSKSEVNKYINKILHYEKADINISYSYINNFFMTCSFLNEDKSDNYRNELDKIRRDSLPNYVNHWYLYDHHDCTCPSNTHNILTANTPYMGELRKENFINVLNYGTVHGFPHLMFFKDHGTFASIGTSVHDKGESATVSDILTIQDSVHYNIILTGSCNTANFAENCVGETFLMKNTVAYIGNTDSGLTAEIGILRRFLYKLFGEQNSPQNVGAIYSSLLDVLYGGNYGYHRLHLLGDPEMPVWTNIPQDLNVTVSPTSRIVASWQEPTTIKVRVNNLPAGETATVCIMKDTEVYKVMEISDTEEHRFQCTPLTAGTMHVTVTAHNFRPHETAIPVVANVPTLSIDDVEFLSGNDGIISPGEDVQLRVTLKNNGASTISGVEATMGTASPYITFVRNQLSCGEIESGGTRTFTNTFRFNVSADAPEILRNDFNGTTFHLMMNKGNLGVDIDTFRVNLIPPKYKFVSHKRSGSSTVAAGGTYIFTSEIVNLGKIEATPRMEIIPETAGVDTVIYQGNGIWRVTLASDYQSGTSVKLRANLYGDNILSDSHVIEMKDSKLSVASSSIGFHEGENTITLYWTKSSSAYGYHVYRSTTPTGTYTRMNKMPLTDGFFIDENLDANTTYYYKVSAVNQSMVEGNPSATYITAHTLCGTMEGFPIYTGGAHQYLQKPTTADVDYDGQKEIIAMARDINSFESKAMIIKSDGTPFNNGENNSITNAFLDLYNYWATPTVADIYGTGEPCIIILPYSTTLPILCYSSMDKNRDNKPDSLWAKIIGAELWENAVITDLDAPNGKGEKEIIALGNPKTNRITVLDCNGAIKWQTSVPTGYNTSSPAVADLDNDGYKEIVCGNEKNVYIWKHDGSSFGNSTVFFTSTNNDSLDSSPIVCDLDKDGSKEIIIASSKTSTSNIYVIKQDGTCLTGFDGSASSASIPFYTGNAGLNHTLSVGDIDADGNLEIVALGKNYIKAWNHDGSIAFSRYMNGVLPSSETILHSMSPALADVDGDESIDILFSINDKIYALDNTGNEIEGFPLTTSAEVRKGVTVSDIDNDGLNEIIAGDNVGKLYTWKTLGKSTAIEWGRAQFDTENTSEYISGYKDPWVITSNTTWEGGTFTNDIIIRSGTFMIPQGVTLDMRKPYRIYVMNGGTLNVVGGRITNADIVVKSGGTLNVAGDAQITLRTNGGNLQVDKGAVMNMPLGTVR